MTPIARADALASTVGSLPEATQARAFTNLLLMAGLPDRAEYERAELQQLCGLLLALATEDLAAMSAGQQAAWS